MSHYPIILNQLFNFIPRHAFEKSVKMYKNDEGLRHFKSWNQFIVLLYSQISGKMSLRDIESSLLLEQRKFYHLGLQSVRRSTLSDSMKRTNHKIYEDLFHKVLGRAFSLAPKHKFRFKNPLYSLDATVIDLCLSVFDWAKYRKQKGAIKLHCGLDHRGFLPFFCVVTDGKQHEIKVTKSMFNISSDSIYCFDKAYIDYQWLYSIHLKGAYFVTRNKRNSRLHVIGQHKISKDPNVLSDEIVKYVTHCDKIDNKYPETLRLIRFKDPKTNKIYEYITNNFKLAASTIAEIYKQRWQIEIFFKWIKQNLKIKTFLGTSKNAVLSQIWIAMTYYVLLAYIKFQSKCSATLTELARRFKSMVMQRINLLEIIFLSKNNLTKALPHTVPKQLTLF